MDTATDTEKLSKRVPHSERVYLAMRDELMSGRISPWSRLAEERLSEKFSVSRTPVREALARLTADGLIEKRDGGFFMYMPSFDEMVDYYELRILLELRGFDRLIDNPTLKRDHTALEIEVDWWRSLRSNVPAPEAGFVANDERFHTALLGSAGNAALTRFLRQVNQRIRPVRMYDYVTEDRMLATITEHIAIGELALSDDMPGAKAALREHIGESRDVVMSRVSASMLSAGNAAQAFLAR
ncbi:GntR family transcriptional regulator [Marisediminicola sp. LYQ85]|uniref:GntR family transcriptional regulator n=1 Tax=Marisediminicola sp. LYQ85 TaxID=3391062 RepID=UPI003983D98A